MASDEMLNEFFNEAIELIDEAESSLINLDKGEDFSTNFNSLFRCFHSIKGAAGMFEFDTLQKHMHYLENLIEKKKKDGKFSAELIDYLLMGIDATKNFLDIKEIDFEYHDPDNINSSISDNKDNVIELRQKAEVKNKELKTESLSNGLIYILDDEEEILEALTIILEHQGFNVQAFLTAEQLYDAISQRRPDTVLTDLNLGKISGLEVMRKIHKKNPHLPFVVISGFVTKDICIEVLRYGVSGIIEKPFDNQAVVDMTMNCVQKYKAFKLLNKSIDLIIYQFSEFDAYLLEKGNSSFREFFRKELKTILEKKKSLMAG